MIPYSRQFISQNDIKNVTKVLKSKFITQGKKVEEFENRLSNIAMQNLQSQQIVQLVLCI